MGLCSSPEVDWEQGMIDLEERCFAASGITMEHLKRDYVELNLSMEEAPYRVRVFDIDDGTDKKTLVLLHGFGMASCMFGPLLSILAKQYRLVLFDNLGWGLNSRLKESKALESAETAEAWVTEMLCKTMGELDLPAKFYLAGFSHGGWQACLYASQAPERVESLFLISAAGIESYDEATYDRT